MPTRNFAVTGTSRAAETTEETSRDRSLGLTQIAAPPPFDVTFSDRTDGLRRVEKKDCGRPHLGAAGGGREGKNRRTGTPSSWDIQS